MLVAFSGSDIIIYYKGVKVWGKLIFHMYHIIYFYGFVFVARTLIINYQIIFST